MQAREWWDANGHKGKCPVWGDEEMTAKCSCGSIPPTKDFYVTFKRSAERKFPAIFVDGWVRIRVTTAGTGVNVLDDAYEIATEKFGTTWHLIKEGQPSTESYPRGELLMVMMDAIGSYSAELPGDERQIAPITPETAEFVGKVAEVMQANVRDTNEMLQDNIALQGVGAVRRLIVEQNQHGQGDWTFSELWKICDQAEQDIIDYLGRVRSGSDETA